MISHDEVANAHSPIADIVVTIVQVTLESWSCQNGLRPVGPGGEGPDGIPAVITRAGVEASKFVADPMGPPALCTSRPSGGLYPLGVGVASSLRFGSASMPCG